MIVTDGEIEGKRRKKQNKGTLFKCTCLSNYLDLSDSLMFGCEGELNKMKRNGWWQWQMEKLREKEEKKMTKAGFSNVHALPLQLSGFEWFADVWMREWIK